MPILELATLAPDVDPVSQADEHAAHPALDQTSPPGEAQAMSRGEKRLRRWEAARDRLRGSANKPPALSEEFRARLNELNELRHIRRATECYQVEIWRGKTRFRKGFFGFSPESLQAAMRARDEAVALLPPRRMHLVPAEVLSAVGVAAPVPGITRFPARSVYRVDYLKSEARRGTKLFYFRHVPEADAYAAAVAFTDEVFADKVSGRKPCSALRTGREPLMREALIQLRTKKGIANSESLPQPMANNGSVIQS